MLSKDAKHAISVPLTFSSKLVQRACVSERRIRKHCAHGCRRIVECQFQHIVYSEWLPIVVGPQTMTRFGLTPRSSGSTTYNDSVDATMLNEFAAAAFRLGHTLIDGTFAA